MSKSTNKADSIQSRWGRFRFSIIGPLLSAPPESGTLKTELSELSKKQWQHPITGKPVWFAVSTLERWFYAAKKAAIRSRYYG